MYNNRVSMWRVTIEGSLFCLHLSYRRKEVGRVYEMPVGSPCISHSPSETENAGEPAVENRPQVLAHRIPAFFPSWVRGLPRYSLLSWLVGETAVSKRC